MKYQMKTLILAALILFVMVGSPKVQADEGCITSSCHADMGAKEFLHGPMGAKICVVCHVKQDGKDHEFKLYLEKEELCLACHEESRDMMLQEHLHTPVAVGDCVGCHDPHESDYRYTLKGRAADLCYVCHDRAKFTDEHVHGPIAENNCNVCHNPHASPNKDMLLDPPDQICFRCHAEKIEEMQKRHVHPPVAENCVSCHNVHAAPERALLSQLMPDLCFSCHGEYGVEDVPHAPVAQGQCETCHDSHASDDPVLLVQPGTDLCYSCHGELGEFIAEQDYLHGPVKQGDCNACHDPHGSKYSSILKKYFPKEFYMPYKTESYALCFECHNKTVALDPKTDKLTDFRDGDVNLHYLHVNKDPKGRSCRACHQVHATDQQKHVRKSVPFGSMNWELPVKFTKFDDGGSCVVGCHAVFEYHR